MNKSELYINSELEQEAFQLTKSGDLVGLRTMIASHDLVNLTPYGMNLFLHAVIYNKLKIAQLMHSIGIDINASDGKGKTALHFAAKLNYKNMVAWLVQIQPEINVQDQFGNTPILDAVFALKEDTEIIEVLLRKGADSRMENIYQVSALSLARSKENNEILRLFEK